MQSPVRPELPTASAGSSQATTAAVEKSHRTSHTETRTLPRRGRGVAAKKRSRGSRAATPKALVWSFTPCAPTDHGGTRAGLSSTNVSHPLYLEGMAFEAAACLAKNLSMSAISFFCAAMMSLANFRISGALPLRSSGSAISIAPW